MLQIQNISIPGRKKISRCSEILTRNESFSLESRSISGDFRKKFRSLKTPLSHQKLSGGRRRKVVVNSLNQPGAAFSSVPRRLDHLCKTGGGGLSKARTDSVHRLDPGRNPDRTGFSELHLGTPADFAFHQSGN